MTQISARASHRFPISNFIPVVAYFIRTPIMAGSAQLSGFM
jgi:hypothetical protein